MSIRKAQYKCEDCAATFNRPSRLEIHLRTHTGERPFVCEYEGCGRNFTNSSHLKRHETTHESSYKCTVEGCTEILKTKATLKKHVDIFHQKKKTKLYECTECSKAFNKRNWLQSHMFKHTGKCPYKCPVENCGKEFLVPSKLKRHMKIHDGYKCNIPGCKEVFLKWSLYVTHLKQFHPKVHKCPVCQKEFSTTSNLKSHSQVHEHSRPVFPCDMPDCTRFYFAQKNLDWHVKSYHEARPHACHMESCHRAFKTKDELDYHKQHHVKRTRRKKKKPNPGFAAVLSGCADPRKCTKKMPPERATSESSDEFKTDEEVSHCQDTSIEEHSLKKPSGDNADEEANMDKEISQKEFCSRTIEGLERDKRLTQTNNPESRSDESSGRERPSKRTKLKPVEIDFGTNEGGNPFLKVISSAEYVAVTGDHGATANSSGCGLKQKSCLDDSASSSEYETITVSLLNGVGDKNYSESDEISSCLSDAGG